MNTTYNNNYKIDNFDEIKGIFTGVICKLGENDKNQNNLHFDKNAFDSNFNNNFINSNIEHNNAIKTSDSVKIWKDDNFLYGEIKLADYFKQDEKRYNYLINQYKKNKLYFSLGGKIIDSELKKNNHFDYCQNLKRYGRAKRKDIVYKFKLDHIAFTTTPVDQEAEVFHLQSMDGVASYNILIDDNYNKEQALINWQTHSGSLEKPSPIYNRGFLFTDNTDLQDFSSYKYLFVDVVDEKVYISQQAIIDLFNEIYTSNIDKFVKIKLLEKIDLILIEINKIREEKQLSTISFNKMSTKQEINLISGKMSAIKFLKNNKNLSNNMINNFVEKLFDLNKNNNNIENRGQSPALIVQSAQCEEQPPIPQARKEINLIELANLLKQKNK